MLKKKGRRMMASEEISIFCQQIGLILSAGIPLYEGVEALCGDLTDMGWKAEFEALSRRVNATGSLARALEESGIFPRYMVEMTRIGESTGRLEQVMAGLQAHYDRESRIRTAMLNAVAYPALLMVMMAGVIGVLMVKVLPVFERTMGGLEMSAGTQTALLLGMNLGRAVLVVVALVIVAGTVLCLLLRTGLRDRVIAAMSRMVSSVEKITDNLAASRFASVMAMMLSSGYPMEAALRMVPNVMENARARARVEQIARDVQQGIAFCDAVRRCALYSPLHMRMIRTGDMAGQLEQVMDKISAIYAEYVDERLERVVSIIEPTLAVVLSVVIGAILLSVMLPVAGMISSVV